VHFGQEHIADNQSGLDLLNQLKAAFTIKSRMHLETLVAQKFFQQGRSNFIVVYDYNFNGHSAGSRKEFKILWKNIIFQSIKTLFQEFLQKAEKCSKK